MADLIATHAELARIGIDRWIETYGKDRKKVYPRMGWKHLTTTQQYERMRQEGGFTYAPVVNEAAQIVPQSFNTGYQKDYYWVKRGLGYRCSIEKLETDQYKIVAKAAAEKMAIAMNKTKESTAANIWNNMTSTGAAYVGADAVALVSASHPYDGGTWSNRGTGASNTDVDFSYTALEDALAKLLATVDEKGIPDPKVGPFKLFVPNELVGPANRVVKAMRLPGTNDNDPNYAGGMITEVVGNPWFTDTDAWMLQSADDAEHGMIELTHGSRRVTKKPYEETEEFAWFMTEKWLFHHVNARGVWGTVGA